MKITNRQDRGVEIAAETLPIVLAYYFLPSKVLKSLFAFLTSGAEEVARRRWRDEAKEKREARRARGTLKVGIYNRVLSVYRVMEAGTEGFASN